MGAGIIVMVKRPGRYVDKKGFRTSMGKWNWLNYKAWSAWIIWAEEPVSVLSDYDTRFINKILVVNSVCIYMSVN